MCGVINISRDISPYLSAPVNKILTPHGELGSQFGSHERTGTIRRSPGWYEDTIYYTLSVRRTLWSRETWGARDRRWSRSRFAGDPFAVFFGSQLEDALGGYISLRLMVGSLVPDNRACSRVGRAETRTGRDVRIEWEEGTRCDLETFGLEDHVATSGGFTFPIGKSFRTRPGTARSLAHSLLPPGLVPILVLIPTTRPKDPKDWSVCRFAPWHSPAPRSSHSCTPKYPHQTQHIPRSTASFPSRDLHSQLYNHKSIPVGRSALDREICHFW